MSTSKFKVGDKVRCRSNRYYASLTVGKLYTIKAITPSGLNSVLNDDNDKCSYPSQLFELAEAACKFKVGDKVRCVRGCFKWIKLGKVYEVIRLDSHGYWVQNDSGFVGAYSESAFELVVDDAHLTPEEVFEHLRKGTKLQHLIPNHGWRDVTTPNEMYFEDICNEQFRIKPEPEIITLNGKRYQALED